MTTELTKNQVQTGNEGIGGQYSVDTLDEVVAENVLGSSHAVQQPDPSEGGARKIATSSRSVTSNCPGGS